MQTSSEVPERLTALDVPPLPVLERAVRVSKKLFSAAVAEIWIGEDGACIVRTESRRRGAPEIDMSDLRAGVAANAPLLADGRGPIPMPEGGWEFYLGVPVTFSDGRLIGVLSVADRAARQLDDDEVLALCDVATGLASDIELHRLAGKDAVTGLLSRSAFRDHARRDLTLAVRHRHDLACLIMDLLPPDGTSLDDRMRAEVGQALMSRLRASDLAARIGHDRLAVLLPHAGRPASLKVGEKLRRALRDVTPGLDARIGISALDRSVTTVEALLQRAEEALGEAGGDRQPTVAVWQATAAVEAAAGPRRVLKAGRISFNNGHSTIDCTVRAISPGGVIATVETTKGIPELVKLQIDSGGVYRLCRAIPQGGAKLELIYQDVAGQPSVAA